MDLDHYILHKEYKFDGFIVDLMTELEKELNCTFLLKATESNTGLWGTTLGLELLEM